MMALIRTFHMTVAVTGAAGHVGGNLVRALLARGRSVRAVVHSHQRGLEDLDIEIARADVRDLASLRRALSGAKVVYHTAAHISLFLHEAERLQAINVLGTSNVVAACLSCGVERLVHFSSIHALAQEPLDVPLDESRHLIDSARADDYSRSKAASELEIQKGLAQGLDAIILNPTAIIGPYDYGPSHFGQALLAFSRGRVPAVVPGGYDWVDVRDVVEGAIRAEREAPTAARYILSGHWMSIADLARTIAELSGARAPFFVCPMGLAYAGAPVLTLVSRLVGMRPLFTLVSLQALRCANRWVSHDLATEQLAYRPRPLAETVADSLRWFSENARLTSRAVTYLQEAS